MKLLLVVLVLAGCFGCTEQMTTRQFGGTSSHVLDPCRKLVNVTWKETNLWVLTRPMHADEAPETYEFIESSTFGMLQGKVVIAEKACAR